MKLPRSLALLAVAAASPALAGTITTTFASNNGNGGNMFDVDVLGGALTVEALSLNISGGTVDVSVYVKSGTWVGANNTPGAWTLVSQNNGVTAAGTDNPTFVDVADFTLNASSTSALYIVLTSGIRYTNATAGHGVFASNADIAIHSGAGTASTAGLFPVFFNDNRTWNGTIQYSLAAAVPEPGTFALFALGAAGFGGVVIRRRRRKA